MKKPIDTSLIELLAAIHGMDPDEYRMYILFVALFDID